VAAVAALVREVDRKEEIANLLLWLAALAHLEGERRGRAAVPRRAQDSLPVAHQPHDERRAARALEWLAAVAGAHMEWARAGRPAAAAGRARRALGGPPAAVAWADGQAVSPEQAVASAGAGPPETPLRVRLALHTGEADLRGGDYYGGAVNRAARLRAVAHGGQALLSQATHDLVRDALPAGVAVRDLGEHRLSDLQRPERVYQLSAAGVPADFPPLRSLDALPTNLPRQLTSFVGREGEVAEVRRLLGAGRLLTLTGPGGVGKTRLALEAGAARLDAHPGGVWLVDLAPLADPALVPQAVAAAVGVRDPPGAVSAAVR
jgi:class 3 adenylate cyclase